MAGVRKQQKQLRKDQMGPREVLDEVADEIRDGRDSQPIVKNPNRDRARGDRDRSGNHHDAGETE
jgi:hypothetical protein